MNASSVQHKCLLVSTCRIRVKLPFYTGCVYQDKPPSLHGTCHYIFSFLLDLFATFYSIKCVPIEIAAVAFRLGKIGLSLPYLP